MNFFGLARRSVFRKPVKSILLLLIVFAISTLLLAGVASKNASIEVQDKTRQAIGAGFLLEKNAESIEKTSFYLFLVTKRAFSDTSSGKSKLGSISCVTLR